MKMRMNLMMMAGSGAALCAAAHADWVNYANETSTRLVAAAGLGSADPEEKDFAYADVDNDGDIDLIVVRKQPFTVPNGKRNVFFRNEGGVLVDRSVEFTTAADDGGQGFLDITNDRDVAIADFDGDGWLDFVTCPALNQALPKTISHPRIYRNLGVDGQGNWLGFKYEQARIPQMPEAPNGCGIATGDLTGDGKPDIYVVAYQQGQGDRLLINNGSGFFTDETLARMTQTMIASGFGTAGSIVDMNGDGVRDVVKSENGPFKASYNNPANQGFFNKHEVPSSGAHYGMSTGDLNNDGKIDVVVGDDGSDRYLLNTGNNANGTANFESKTFSFQSGGDDGFGNNSRIVDLNNDGFNDVLIADVDVDIGGCSRRLHIYRNLGNAPSVTIQDQGTGGIPAASLTGTHDVAVFDLNNDGWKDLILGRCSGISIWMNVPPIGMVTSYPNGLPAFLSPNAPTSFPVRFTPVGGGVLVPGSPTLHYKIGAGAEQTVALAPLQNGDFQATIPGTPCTTTVKWWVSSNLSPGNVMFNDPSTAPALPYTGISATGSEITYRDEFENAIVGWTVNNDASLTGGGWQVADPNGTVSGGQVAAPEDDATSGDGVKCWVTQNGTAGGSATAADVDGGPTTLTSPVIDLLGEDALISYSYWFFCSNATTGLGDRLFTRVSNDDGATWVEVSVVTASSSIWQNQTFRVSDFVTPTATVRVRFVVADSPNNSTTEAGIDNFQIEEILCSLPCPADLTGDGLIDGVDLATVLGAWGTTGTPGFPSDINVDGVVDGADLAIVLGSWGDCP